MRLVTVVPGLLLAGAILASLPTEGGAQTPAPPRVSDYYGGLPPGAHETDPPASPDDYDSGIDDPYRDPDHPFRGTKDPGPAWNDAERGKGVGIGRWKEPADWDWQELFYEGTYPTALHVTNRCDTPEPVYITHDLPYLEIQPDAVIPPGGTDVPAVIRTPMTPSPPIRTGAPDEPGYGWVEPPHYDPATGTSTRLPGEPEFHQPNFLQVDGRVSIWHPWRDPCMPNRQEWTVTGHVHFRPPPPEGGDEGPREIASPDPCVVYWNLGSPPSGFDGRDCTDVFRGLAIDYVRRIVEALVAEDPEAWAWLPGGDAIRSMTADEVLALKNRADASP